MVLERWQHLREIDAGWINHNCSQQHYMLYSSLDVLHSKGEVGCDDTCAEEPPWVRYTELRHQSWRHPEESPYDTRVSGSVSTEGALVIA